MSKTQKFALALVGVVILLLIGDYAKRENLINHHKMALKECGTVSNIKHVDSKGFECVKPLNP